MAGFTEEGLVIPRQPEIIEDLVALEKIYIHPDVNTNPDELLGELNNVWADRLRLGYEYIEAAYNQTRLSSATGKALDELGVQKNVSRLLASPSFVDVTLEGINDIIIPSNSLVEDRSTKQRFLTQAPKRISNLGCIGADLTITTSAPSTAFTITINGVPYTRSTPGSGVVMATTLGLLAGDINTAAIGVTASSTSTTIIINSNTSTPFDVIVNTSFSYTLIKTKIRVKSLLSGSTTAATPGTWNILSPVPGWNKVYPIIGSLVSGRDDELDEDFRLRIKSSNSAVGKGTTRAVKVALRNTVGVLHSEVFENTSISTVGALPPYSINCVVDGGDDNLIAQTIWETKGSATHTEGTTSIVYTDEFLDDYVIKFSRPSALSVDVKITLIIFEEETLTPDYVNIIKDSVVSFINNLGLGKDIIPSQMYVPIYTNVDGVNVTNIEVKPAGSGSFSNTRFTIAPNQYAATLTSNISIV